MSDQGKVLVTFAVPTAATDMGLGISGAGTHSASLRAIGVTADHTAAGVILGPVQIGGTCLAVAGEAITAGESLQMNAVGRMVTAVPATGIECGVAMEAAAAAGVLFKMKIN